nr:MAG TPA: hypothetical protein [Caudoviricetes sp.]DAM73468.1 MAG TPA: hypothetical protein [Caudoviricetes sp.]DAS26349.1 MAG TPA: hypothetical protein [Caudoviricetes sp.]
MLHFITQVVSACSRRFTSLRTNKKRLEFYF